MVCNCGPQYCQVWPPLSEKLNTPLRPPSARYLLWKILLLNRVAFSSMPAPGWSPLKSAACVPLPQYTQTRVLLATSLATLTVGSLLAHAGSVGGPHISSER